jgi:hypothetical protein
MVSCMNNRPRERPTPKPDPGPWWPPLDADPDDERYWR